MRRPLILIFAACTITYCVFTGPTGLAQQSNEDVNIPSGLETTEVSPGVRVVTPIGGKVRRVNDNLSVIEDADEYAARNFVAVNKKLKEFEKENEELKKEIKDIKEKLDQLLKRYVVYE